MSDFSENILEAFNNTQQALNILCLHILDDLRELPVSVDANFYLDIKNKMKNKDQELTPKDDLIYALKHVAHIQGLAAQETFSCPGAIGCSANTILLIDLVNAAKDTFREAIKQAAQELGGPPYKAIRDVLAQAGYGVVKLKQVCRHISYIDYHPGKISWTKARNSAHVVISHSEAHEKLLKAGEGELIDIQLSKLELLPKTEKLVVRQDIKPYWIVNIAKFKSKIFGTQYQKIRTSLPLFYIYDSSLPEPQFQIRERKERKTIRADKLIEKEPFLPTINAYRYIARI